MNQLKPGHGHAMPVDVEAGRGVLAAMVQLLSRLDVRVNGDWAWDTHAAPGHGAEEENPRHE